MIHWPRGAHIQSAADIPAAHVNLLGMLSGPIVAAFCVVCVWCYGHYHLTRERHEEIQAALDDAAAPTSGRSRMSNVTITPAPISHTALRALDVEHVFGIVSVHNIPIYDAILRHGGITPIDMRHEQAAVHAADGYARACGKLGVAITSTGPGACNAVPGLFEAGFASSPVLMVTGQIDTPYLGKGKGFLHEAERQLEMLRTVTRRAERCARRLDRRDADSGREDAQRRGHNRARSKFRSISSIRRRRR